MRNANMEYNFFQQAWQWVESWYGGGGGGERSNWVPISLEIQQMQNKLMDNGMNEAWTNSS